MKLKHRALTLLLSVAMLIAFMPAMAFADPIDEDDWCVTNSEETYLLEDDPIELTVETDYAGDSEAVSYQWYIGESPEEGVIIDNATGCTYTVSEVGKYSCLVTVDGESDYGVYYVTDHWFVTNENDEFPFVDGQARIEVETNYKGDSTPSYKWFYSTDSEN